jgi:DnaJ-class molecular chaperone
MQTEYIKFFKKAQLFTLMCVVLTGILLTSSCEKDEETNDVTILNSFGPCPIARGAELRFIGENLDKVDTIVLPGDITITSEAFGTHSSTLITITVPQNAVPGHITLKSPDGAIITKTELDFSEPISINSFSPTSTKADSVITITGDYLNLIKQVIFNSNVTVDQAAFISQSRNLLKVKVPEAAQTGKIAISNGADNPIIIYTTIDLTLALPVIASVTPNPVKAGSDITITGTDLNLVKTIILGGDIKVAETLITTKKSNQIVLTVPENTKDGKVTLMPASGVKIVSANDLIMVVPTVSVTPTTVKNGGTITVNGTDLDLINVVTFGGSKTGTIQAGGTATQINVTVPNDALTGAVKFTTKADKDVLGPIITLIDPTFTSVAPTSSRAKADIVITGTDLDLVANVVFSGSINGTIGARSETQLTVNVPIGAKTGKITLVTKNGTQIQSGSDFTVLANLPTITSFTESRGEPGKILTINGTDLLLIKQLVFPGNIAATDYGVKSDTKVEVYVPTNVTVGTGSITVITYEGDEGLLPSIFFGSVDPIKADAHIIVNYDDKNNMWGGGGFANGQTTNPTGVLGNYARWTIAGATDGWNDPSNCGTWAGDANGLSGDPADYVLKIDFFANKPFSKAASIEFTIGGKASRIYPPADMDKTSGWITITVPMTQFGVSSMSGLGDIAMNVRAASSTPVDLEYCLDNIRIEKK